MGDNSQELFSEDTKLAADVANVIASRGVSLNRLLELSDTDTPDAPRQIELGETNKPEFGQNAVARDPQFPLANGEDEDFALRIVEGAKPGHAYKEAYHSRATYASCKQQASRRLRESEIEGRVRWLIAEKNRKTRQAAMGGGSAEPLSIEEKLELLQVVIRDRNANWSDRVAAMREHAKIVQEDSGNQPKSLKEMDPTEIMDYFNRCAKQGLDPVQVAIELQRKEDERLARVNAPPVAKETASGGDKATVEQGGAQPVGGTA